jgi:hypothetical protein
MSVTTSDRDLPLLMMVKCVLYKNVDATFIFPSQNLVKIFR